MKKVSCMLLSVALLGACTHLTKQEQDNLHHLKAQGVTVDRPVGNYETPASPAAAGLLNILPGFGNFYLACGNGADSTHWLYGTLNLLLWPISVVWGVPEAVVDANRINEREMIYYYQYDKHGKEELQKANIAID